MITVQLNEPNFEYDIHSLVIAFYPQHDVLVKAMPREEFPESVFHLVVNYDRKNHMIDFKFFEHNQKETQEEVDVVFEKLGDTSVPSKSNTTILAFFNIIGVAWIHFHFK